MHNVRELLLQVFGPGDWAIEKPQHGRQKECYIASNRDRKVFIKFDLPIKSLQRLSDIGLAPRVLASGSYQGTPYVIQEFLDGTHPSREWLVAHVDEVAKLIKTYHEDVQLAEILAEDGGLDYRDRLNQDLGTISKRLEGLENPGQLRTQFAHLREIATSFEDVALVPVHNEPNTANMLLEKDNLTFIDWDEVLLSDPMRDIGGFLWWYVSASQWKDFFRSYGASLTPQQEAKIYWFAARASLVIYLWRMKHEYPDAGFREDFVAALNLQPNPHMS
jgi:aminoglycoside phosphotransferase (APT) family kinase protein